MNKPPKISLRFLRWFCRKDLQKYIEGDLFELFEEQVETKGLNKARLLFTWEVLKLFRPDIIRLNRSITQINQWTMFKNYLKVGIRNILKYKTFSFINVFGLAVAMSVAMLIILMIVDQKQADRFHEHTERMFRVVTRSDDGPRNASTPIPLAEALQEEPSVEYVTQLVKGVGGDLVFPDGQSSTEIRGFFADDQFFQVFGFDLVQGNANSALSNPRSIVISQRVAERLFDGDAVGKSVTFTDRGLDPIQIDLGMSNGKEARDWGGFIISGVVDVASVKSHIQYDALISVASIEPLVKANQLDENLQNNVRNWGLHSGAYTYVLQKESTSPEELTASLQRIMADKKELIGEKSFEVQSFSEINLGEFMGTPISLRLPIEAYYVLSILALVILISAILNYTNLSIARSLTRTKEIGVRKVNGATKNDIFSQFMVESVLIAFISLFVANGILLLLKPMFQSMWLLQPSNSLLAWLAPKEPDWKHSQSQSSRLWNAPCKFVLCAYEIDHIPVDQPATALIALQPPWRWLIQIH
jgi:putative ABC transport system permease protein